MDTTIDRETFLKVISYLDNFILSLPGGTSYWVDPKGETHYTDVGYGIDFWVQVSEYLKENYGLII